jgi:16S rRNA (adenine(1408)-N(1))-methyltransferase
VVAAAESLPATLDGRADALTVHFPWGSLLRGLLEADPAILAGIARVTRPGAAVSLLLSVTERDRFVGRTSLDERTFATLAPGYAAQGLLPCEARPATADDLARSRSSWAKRLGAGSDRPAWSVRFRRADASPSGASDRPGEGTRLGIARPCALISARGRSANGQRPGRERTHER